jgi:hypothetical protein
MLIGNLRGLGKRGKKKTLKNREKRAGIYQKFKKSNQKCALFCKN